MDGFLQVFKPSEIKLSETKEYSDPKEQLDIPSMDDLKNKLEDIFSAKIPEDESIPERIPGISQLGINDFESVVLEDGTTVTLPREKSFENISRADDQGIIYLKDGALISDTTYELNGNTYNTDEQGRIIHCRAYPERSINNSRDISAQLQAGSEDRRPLDQGAHIVSRDLNGDSGIGNLVAMDSRINQSDYKRMENDVKASLEDGKDVIVNIDLDYIGDSKRPETITVTTIADGVQTIYKFDNNLDGGLKKDVPENGKEIVKEELNDTNGEISSIKEEYDANGELNKTTVNITYTDENGTNHRTQVYIAEKR